MLKPAILKSCAVLALVWLSACSQGFLRVTDPDGTVTSWHFSSDVGGKILWSVLTPQDLATVPDWDPSQPNRAPLELDEAIRIARADLGRYVSDSSTWEVGNLQIDRLTGSKWVILVSWVPTDPNVKGTLRIPVLPSGRAVPLEEIKVNVGDEAAGT